MCVFNKKICSRVPFCRTALFHHTATANETIEPTIGLDTDGSAANQSAMGMLEEHVPLSACAGCGIDMMAPTETALHTLDLCTARTQHTKRVKHEGEGREKEEGGGEGRGGGGRGGGGTSHGKEPP